MNAEYCSSCGKHFYNFDRGYCPFCGSGEVKSFELIDVASVVTE